MSVEKKLYTVADFEEFLRLPENQGRLFELINGEVIEKLPTQEHGVIAARITIEIGIYLKQNPIGRVGVEVRHRPAEDEHNDRLPDVSFTTGLDKPLVKEGAVLAMPDLAVEIKSPDDTYKAMRETGDYYLAHGARMVWLIYPEKKVVEVLTPTDRQILTEADTLDGGDVLPGFKLSIHDLLAD